VDPSEAACEALTAILVHNGVDSTTTRDSPQHESVT